MDERLISLGRWGRLGLQIALEPIDWTARLINGRTKYPPLYIRQKVGNLFDFETSGAEYASYLKLLCNLKPGDNLLDIGCGCGLMALQHNENPSLPEYLFPGTYCGLDKDLDLITWCNRRLERPGVMFKWLPNGSPYDVLFGPENFNVVLCKSLFTHLFPEETAGYIEEIKGILKPGGSCLATFFLLDKEERRGRYKFKTWSEGDVGYERPTKPRLAVGYRIEGLEYLLDGLELEYEIYKGSWRGHGGGLSFQDIVIIRKVK